MSRGVDAETQRERRRREDAACTAGLRNPHHTVPEHTELVEIMHKVKEALQQARSASSELQGLTRCCGEHGETPPSTAALELARKLVCDTLGSATQKETFIMTHHRGDTKSCRKYYRFRAIQINSAEHGYRKGLQLA